MKFKRHSTMEVIALVLSLSTMGFLFLNLLIAGLISNVFGVMWSRILGGVVLLFALASLVMSIINMAKKDRDKTLSIIALVLSSIYVIVFFIILTILFLYQA